MKDNLQRVTRHGPLAALLLLLLTAAPLACVEPKSVVCPQSGRICAVACAADGETCIMDSCGDRVIDPGEQCDDGNKSDEDDCLSSCTMARCGDGVVNSEGVNREVCDYKDSSVPCNLNCTSPVCGDGLVTASTREECDSGSPDSTATCDTDCTIPRCGDGDVNPAAGEECDDGNGNDNDDCLSTCKLNRCGDGHLRQTPNQAEVCDDGNTTAELHCRYGTQSCTNYCNENCSATLTLTGSYCGDGQTDLEHGEACDDGNSITEGSCPEGVAECSHCSADCKDLLALRGPVCGNGRQEPGEACDDGNADSCGSCSANCKRPNTAVKARGTIVLVNHAWIEDGDRFSIADGIHDRVAFEYDRNNQVTEGRVGIDLANLSTAEEVMTAIASAINDQPDDVLAISATVRNSRVELEHLFAGDFGRHDIKVWPISLGFSVSGMSRGSMLRCSEFTGCTQNDDCDVGLTCQNNQCAPPP
jgi:cysteine-rich repeat protein